MRVKLSIFVLSAFLLWSSVLTTGYHVRFSKHQELKIACQVINKAILADDDFIWKKLSVHAQTALANFTVSKIQAWLQLPQTVSTFTNKSAKFYLLFRVLRN